MPLFVRSIVRSIVLSSMVFAGWSRGDAATVIATVPGKPARPNAAIASRNECALCRAGFAPGFLFGEQALEALRFVGQALLRPPQPVLMLRNAVGEIGHVERPLFQADDLVPKLLDTGHAPH